MQAFFLVVKLKNHIICLGRFMIKFKLDLFLKIEYFRHGGLKRGDQVLSVNGVRKEKN